MSNFVATLSAVLLLALLALTGLTVVRLKHRLRTAEAALHEAAEMARARVQLEDQLRNSEARWRTIIESAVDGVIVIDGHGDIEAFNRAAERLFGYRESETLGHNVNMLMPSPYREEHDGYLSRYMSTGQAKIIGIGREVTGRRKDGTTFPLHLSVGRFISNGEQRFTGIVHDLSARVKLEEQLREQTAMARLGEMAAVIAHEVKNPLAGIRGAIQVIGGRLDTANTDAVMVKEIIARIDSLNAMMKDLLLFARPPRPKPSPIDVVTLLGSVSRLLKEDDALRDIVVDIQGSAPPVMADSEMLRMVFQNLMINGVHAMQGHGTLQVNVRRASGLCDISFVDAGPGIPAEIREKVFTPFFTTKSRGTGLGLPTAKRFIEAHNGRITIDCPPGGGTTVRIQLPAA